jgi:hypothetical protein
MRHNLRLLAAILCAIPLAAAHSQTVVTSPKSPAAKGIPNAMSFHYDAQHDQVIANGLQMKPSAIGAASLPTTTGTITVTINITAVSHFKHGTTYHCTLLAVGGLLDTTNAVISGGLETATGLARWNGVNTLACTLTIPYEWTLAPDPAAASGVILAFGVAAVAPSHDGREDSDDRMVQRSTFQVDGVEPIPANGSTSTFAFNVTL